jgi:23S rRNA (cytidine1920-2'-O)/16S rRNA (cytidine1409-2'-O)-methyltransferase
MKTRLDKILVEQGFVPSRERAQALILAGRVLVQEQRVDKPGTTIRADAPIRILGSDLKYVSRGGLKLEAALNEWKIDLSGQHCVDIGASTGGFTDCMLQNGAAAVLAVDTGYGQIAHKLRTDPRVMLLEKTNARLMSQGDLLSEGQLVPEFLAMDVSFISATLVLPAVIQALRSGEKNWRGSAVILVKPQFEAGREYVGKGGIVRDPRAWELAVERVRQCVVECGGEVAGVIESPITGMEGNREYLLYARFGALH